MDFLFKKLIVCQRAGVSGVGVSTADRIYGKISLFA